MAVQKTSSLKIILLIPPLPMQYLMQLLTNTLDVLAVREQELVLYQWQDNTQEWIQTFTGFLVPAGIQGMSTSDMDFDGHQEICVFGTFGWLFYTHTGEVTFADLPDISHLGTIYQVIGSDIDADQDQDWYLVTQKGVWLVLGHPRLTHPQLAVARLNNLRGLSHSKDALGAEIYIDRDQDGVFEKVLSVQTYGVTLLHFDQADISQERFNLMVIFPDRGDLGENIQIFEQLELDTNLDVIDTQ